VIGKVHNGAEHPYEALVNGAVIGFANDKCIDDEPSLPSGSNGSNGSKPVIKEGARVTLKTNAKKYATGETIPARYKGKRYTIMQVGKNRDKVLLKEIYSWVYVKDVA